MDDKKQLDWPSLRRDAEKAWQQFNKKLSLIHKNQGLDVALKSLAESQSLSGFVRDNLGSVIRYRLTDPDNSRNYYSGQFNPKRAARFGGFGHKEPPVSEARINDGCFLCWENILWQHEGRQMGLDLTLGSVPYVALTNPFPLMPLHIVVASRHHIPQACGVRMEKGEQSYTVATILEHILDLTAQLPDYIVFYNGVGAGASVPHHFHFQTFPRPHGFGLFPLEQSARLQKHFPCWIEKEYPLPSRVWHGRQTEIHEQATKDIIEWVKRNDKNVHNLSANLIATLDPDDREQFFLYFVPRTRETIELGLSTSINIGGLEVLGEMVFTEMREKQRLDSGELDYSAIHNMLITVGTATKSRFPNH